MVACSNDLKCKIGAIYRNWKTSIFHLYQVNWNFRMVCFKLRNPMRSVTLNLIQGVMSWDNQLLLFCTAYTTKIRTHRCEIIYYISVWADARDERTNSMKNPLFLRCKQLSMLYHCNPLQRTVKCKTTTNYSKVALRKLGHTMNQWSR